MGENKKVVIQRKAAENSILSYFFNGLKKASIVGVVYFFGYMHWSIAWFIGPVVLLVIKDQWSKDKQLRRHIQQTTALADEKDVVLARLNDLPSWVFFPDVERVEWLNKIMKQVWPNINNYTRGLIRDVIQPTLKESFERYKLHGFKFDRIILGSVPIRISGVKVFDKNVARNEIIMDVDIFYAGDCDITFYLSGVKGGIKDFELSGTLRIVMKPLISTIPLFGGLQIFFLNNPEIDFDLVGVADFLDMPGLGDMLRRIVIETVASVMVLPNKFPIKLSEEIDACELKAPEPEGVLRVHVVEAKNLMRKDIGVLGKGKSDPYAVVTVGAQEFKTHVIDSTVDPKWDFWCEFDIVDSDGQDLYIHVWDKDEASENERLGRATLEVSNIVRKGHEDLWVTLEQAKHGMVHLRLTWLTLSKDISDLKLALEETQLLRVTDMSTALLTIFLDSAKNLPKAKAIRQPDPYAVLQVGKHKQHTNVIMRSSDPVWEQGFTFLVSNPESDTLYVSIIDKKTEHELSQLIYNISHLIGKPNMEFTKEPFSLVKSGQLVWSMHLRILKQPQVDIQGEPSILTRADSNISQSSVTHPPVAPLEKENSSSSLVARVEEELTEDSSAQLLANDSFIDEQTQVLHRNVPFVSGAGEAGLGRIQITLRYSVQRQRLIIVIHKVVNIPLKDPSSIPDPYVKLYILPERTKDTKRKTQVIKDNCNPSFEEKFEYVMSQGDLSTKQLQVTVGTEKKLFYSSSNILGQVVIDLGKVILPYSAWFDLQPELE